MRRLTDHIRGNLVGYIALVIAMSGTAWAADTIGSGDVIDDSLKSVDLKDGQGVASVDVIDGSLTGAQIDESTLGEVGDSQALDGHPASDFLVRDEDEAGGDVKGSYSNLEIRNHKVGTNQVKKHTLKREDLTEGGAVGWGAVSRSGLLSRDYNVVDAFRIGEGTYCVDAAASINVHNRVIVATPDFAEDDTREFGQTNGYATTVEWDSTNQGGCPSSTYEIDTYRRGSAASGIDYVNWRRDAGFFFMIR